MSGLAYPYGDAYPNRAPKTDDAANFGLFKNNWLAIRTYCKQFSNKTAEDWRMGTVLKYGSTQRDTQSIAMLTSEQLQRHCCDHMSA